jgi:acylpyruvate hydrolase
MRLVTYQREGQVRIGAQHDGWIIDLNRAYRAMLQQIGNDDELAVAYVRVPTDMIELLNGGETSLHAAQQAIAYVSGQLTQGEDARLHQQGIIALSDQVSLLPPVLRPGKVLCLGLNYRPHAAEAGMVLPDYPLLFHKSAGSLIGHNQPIVIPRISNQIDYEGELAFIIGRRGKYIPEDAALSYIAGYSVANDVSARDLQLRTSQWTSGKMLDTFGPLGPVLVTSDEIPDPQQLTLRTTLNEQVVQESTTAEMIFRISYLVSYISTLITLQPGDVILTGTPAGVGNSRTPQLFMQPGDTVTVEIEHVGKLTNPVVAEG